MRPVLLVLLRSMYRFLKLGANVRPKLEPAPKPNGRPPTQREEMMGIPPKRARTCGSLKQVESDERINALETQMSNAVTQMSSTTQTITTLGLETKDEQVNVLIDANI